MKKRKKILYIVTKSAWGGAQRYVFDLATHFAGEGFDIVVACGPSGPLVTLLERAHVRTVTIPELQRDIRFGSEMRSLASLLRLIIRERPDVLHLNSSKVGGLGAIGACLSVCITWKKPRVVFTVHGWAFLEDRSRLWKIATFLFSWISTWFHDAIIVIDRRDLRVARFFIPDNKLSLVTHGIGSIPFEERIQARSFISKRIDHPVHTDMFLMGTVAELTKTKGLISLIEAASHIRTRHPGPFLFAVVGDGEDLPLLKNEIKKHDLEQIVFFAGEIPNAAHYLKAFDAFILPSQKEGLPYAIIEAMTAGLPIIATNVGGIPDLLEHGRGIMVSPKDASGLAGAILSIRTDSAARYRLGAAAAEYAARTFSLEYMTQKTLEVYRLNRSA